MTGFFLGLICLSAFVIDRVAAGAGTPWVTVGLTAMAALGLLLLMPRLYRRQALNGAIITSSVAIYLGVLWLVDRPDPAPLALADPADTRDISQS